MGLAARALRRGGGRLDLPRRPPRWQTLYQFVVDDEWITDPDNPLVEATNGSAASVILKQ
jgi:hypothetical protein